MDAARRCCPTWSTCVGTLHRHPELGLELPLTQAAVLDALDGLGLEVTVGERLSSVVADLGRCPTGPTIVLRGDMDALPMPEDTGLDFASRPVDTMHACGHDAHTSMLVGAARLLAARRESSRTVRFMFQPGEEGDGGAELMIDDGVLDGVDGAFAMHVAPNVPVGVVAWKRRRSAGLGGRAGDHRHGPRRPCLDTALGHRSGAGGVRDRPGSAVDDHPDRRRVRSGGADGEPVQLGHGHQRDRGPDRTSGDPADGLRTHAGQP